MREKPTQRFARVEGRRGTSPEARGSLVLAAPRPAGLREGFSRSSREGSRGAIDVQGPRPAECLACQGLLLAVLCFQSSWHIVAFFMFVYEHTKQNSKFK